MSIPKERIYILDMCEEFCGNQSVPFKTVAQLIAAGQGLDELEPLKWERGQGASQTAYLCYSSGTSGLPVSHMKIHTFNHSHIHGLAPRLYYYLLCFLERRHDQPCQRDCKRFADVNVRETCSGAKTYHETIRSRLGLVTSKPHIWFSRHRPNRHL